MAESGSIYEIRRTTTFT